jgi:lysophosphatidylcholine acyltransferase / lyso-PAF acetyltransferase
MYALRYPSKQRLFQSLSSLDACLPCSSSRLLDGFWEVSRLLPCILAKNTIFNMPALGPLLRASQSISIKRGDETSRRHTEAVLHARNAVEGMPPVLIFPEGTTTAGYSLCLFRTGAFKLGLPVQPYVWLCTYSGSGVHWWREVFLCRLQCLCLRISHTARLTVPYRHYNPCLTTVPSPYVLLWRTLCQFNQRAHIKWLPVYTPSEAECADPALYARNVRAVMAEAAGMSVSEHSFPDMVLYREGKQAWRGVACIGGRMDSPSRPIASRLLISEVVISQLQ